MRVAIVCLGLALTSTSAWAEQAKPTVHTYRDAYLAQCEAQSAEQRAICACGFDKWAGALPDASAEDAMAAARVITEQARSMQDYQLSTSAMGGLTAALLSCAPADFYGGLIDVDEMISVVEDADAAMNDGDVDLFEVFDEVDSGNVTPPPPARRGSAVILDENGEEVFSDRALFEELSVVEGNGYLDIIRDKGVLETPVKDYGGAFFFRCHHQDKLDFDACKCAWLGFVAATEERDGPAERLAAYLATETSIGDADAFSPDVLGDAFEIVGRYGGNRQACFPLPDFSALQE